MNLLEGFRSFLWVKYLLKGIQCRWKSLVQILGSNGSKQAEPIAS